MKVEFRRSFLRDLQKIRDGELRQRVLEAIAAVEEATALADVAKVR